MREFFTLHLLANYQIICEYNITGLDKKNFNFISLDTRSDHRIAIVQ